MGTQLTSKYHNRKVEIDGIVFDSVKEANRYQELRLLERAGEISGLERQNRFCLNVNGQFICTYICDFTYYDKDCELIVEDVKSAVTRKLPAFRLKKKLMKACLGLEVIEV